MMKKLLAFLLIIGSVFMLSACGKTKIVMTTGLTKNEVFRVGSERAEEEEWLLYLVNIANGYEQVYGEELINLKADDADSMLDECKALAMAQLSRIKAMKLLAEKQKLTLTDEEKAVAQTAAEIYFGTLSEEERDFIGIKKVDVVADIYEEKLLADKLYAYFIKDVNPEISDDEARIITVQHVLLKTYTFDEFGNRRALTDKELSQVYKRAEEVHRLALEGESFDALISKYSEDIKGTYAFGKGEMEEAFEEAAFQLATDEIAPVVQTNHGFHIIKCISTLDREATDLNKQKLLMARKQEVFGDTYNEFVSKLDTQINDKLLESTLLPDSNVVDTAELFTIYEEELGELFGF